MLQRNYHGVSTIYGALFGFKFKFNLSSQRNGVQNALQLRQSCRQTQNIQN